MKNMTLLVVMGIMILLVGGFVFANSKLGITGKVSEDPDVSNGEMQRVVIGQKDLNYYPSEIRVNVGQPVEIRMDDSVKGCLRSVVFDLGDKKVSKFLPTTEDTLVFTPVKKGTFNFACSMNMAHGKLIVQ